MLSFIRRWLTSWVVLALLGLLVIAFIVTGVHDPFAASRGAAGGGAAIAEIGDSRLTEQQVQREFEQALRAERQQNPQLTQQQFVAAGGFEAVLDRAIAGAAIDAFAERKGVTVTKRAIDGEIASIPAFQINGRFDEATFRRVLSENRLTEAELREQLRSDLLRRQLLLPVSSESATPRGLAEPYARLLLEQRRGTVAVVPSAAIREVPQPTDAQVQAFYEANRAAYTIPERRAFRYALLGRDTVAARVKVTPAEVEKYYRDNIASYGGVETRTLNQVVVSDEALARRIAAAARGPEGFVKAAALGGFGAADIAVGSRTQAAFAGETSADVAAAAFGLPRGGVTDPIRSSFGFHVVQVTNIEPARPRPLASVAPEIERKLREERADDTLSDLVAKAEDALQGGESLADVAKANGLAVVDVPPITRDGRVQRSTFTLEPAAQGVLAKAFDKDPSEGTTVQELARNQFAVIEPGQVVPPTAVPLAEIRPAVVAAWQAGERTTRARALADQIASAAGKGEPVAALLAARGLPAPQTATVRRLDLLRAGGQVPPALIMLFSIPQGAARVVPAPNGAGFLVVRADAVIAGDAATAAPLVSQQQAQFTRTASEEFAELFARAVQADMGVTRNPAAIAALRRRLSGEALAAEQ